MYLVFFITHYSLLIIIMPSNAIVYTKQSKLDFLPIVSAPLCEYDIRIRTIATSISAGMERFLLTGKSITRKELKFPVVPGSECIGEVIEVGSSVKGVELGEYVYAWKSERWEEVQSVFGCQAESVIVREGDFLPLRRTPEERDVLIGLLADALSAVNKLDLATTERILILGLGAFGLMIAEVLHFYHFNEVDACDMFIQRGDLATARNIALDLSDFTADYNNRYDVIIESTGRLLLLESALRLLKPQGKFLLCGNYEVMKTDYRLLQDKEPQLIFSSLTTFAHRETAKTLIETHAIDVARLLTHRFPIGQYEVAYDVALNRPDCIKTSLLW
jgi:2-desacetyl-2-hydroxyethyl bacteriochlorophyllide A dehydrogenase